jgi:hypothetical protein
VNRIRFATIVAGLALTMTFAARQAHAAGPNLKLKADKETVAADEPVTVTLTAVSTRTLKLPAPIVSVDEGQGFRERTDLSCAGDAAAAKELSPDKASVSSCAIKLTQPGKAKVRLEYRLATGVVRSNAVSIAVGEAGAERSAAK